MYREQIKAVVVYLLIGCACALGAGWLAVELDIGRLTWMAAAIGAGITMAIFALYRRAILERTGYYGFNPERKQRHGISRRSERRTGLAACGAIWLAFVAAGFITGSRLGALACLLAMLAALTLSTGLAEGACIALTEAKWRRRERGK
ncbi:hypothetical protein J5226_12205 [Lysobacter sp. K5869]|uniref:hypothetical protein n=1 Tax=Lysobacter sp. K5869 TaxID=2820808 RepID=UPI001C0612CB|nr:hypothetical protein [Lysobacter sp. K5869]QWP79094.1 hypothetical protein J5226_12205 [Lysobacter sp. K5869]